MSEAAKSVAAAEAARLKELSQSDFNRLLMGVLGLGVLILAILGGVIVWLSIQTRSFDFWVEHTHVAEQQIVTFIDTVDRVETARRGYLLGPTPRQLSAYRAARSDVSASLQALTNTTADNPVQVLNVRRLRPLLAWKAKVNDESVNTVEAGRQAEAIHNFSAEQELQPLFGIRKLGAAMLGEEQRLLGIRSVKEQDAIRLLTFMGLAAAVLLTLLSISATLLMRRFAGSLSRTQAELRELNTALEVRVMERTADLTRANEEIQRFAYIVSHDLRSPLVNVMGFTSELEVAMKPLQALVTWLEERDDEGRMPQAVKQSVDTDIPEAISFIRSSTKKMDGLISAILKLSREGRRVLNPERLDMNAVVRSIFESVHHRVESIGGKAIIDEHLPDLITDRLALEQVIGNLIDNAIKYKSPARPLEITVSGKENLGRVAFEVADNGRGVDPKDHERIFELFRRSGAQTAPGEGIGLAHVRALVHRLGGTINCESALGEGAVFHLTLPKVLTLTEGPSA